MNIPEMRLYYYYPSTFAAPRRKSKAQAGRVYITGPR